MPLFRTVAATVMVAFFLIGSVSHASEKSPPTSLRVITDDNYPPYLFRNDEGAVEGYLVDYWKLWTTKTGIAIELIATDWDSAQKRVLAGEAAVIDMLYMTPPRMSLYDFSAPYADLPVGIYSHSSISGISSISSLKGFQIGVQAGDACIDELNGKGITNLVEYPNYAALIRAAKQQDIKIFCLDEYPANFFRLKKIKERVKALGITSSIQKRIVARALRTKTEVVAHQHVARPQPLQQHPVDEILRAQVGQLGIKRQHHGLVDATGAQVDQLVAQRAHARRRQGRVVRDAGKVVARMRLEGQHAAGQAALLRLAPEQRQHGLVAAVQAVEVADRQGASARNVGMPEASENLHGWIGIWEHCAPG